MGDCGDMDKFGNPIVSGMKYTDFASREDRVSYIQSIQPTRGFWIRAYGKPMEDVQLQELRERTNDAKYWRMFSKSELLTIKDNIVGLHILLDHQDNSKRAGKVKTNQSIGRVVGSSIDQATGSLDVLLRPAQGGQGFKLCSLLELDLVVGFSLQHVRVGDFVQLREGSICILGKVEDTNLLSKITFLDSFPIPPAKTSVYVIPEFVLSVASASCTDDSPWFDVSRHIPYTNGNVPLIHRCGDTSPFPLPSNYPSTSSDPDPPRQHMSAPTQDPTPPTPNAMRDGPSLGSPAVDLPNTTPSNTVTNSQTADIAVENSKSPPNQQGNNKRVRDMISPTATTTTTTTTGEERPKKLPKMDVPPPTSVQPPLHKTSNERNVSTNKQVPDELLSQLRDTMRSLVSSMGPNVTPAQREEIVKMAHSARG